MNTYDIRVRLPQGGFADVRIQAASQYHARQLAEATYGSAAVLAVLGQVS